MDTEVAEHSLCMHSIGCSKSGVSARFSGTLRVQGCIMELDYLIWQLCDSAFPTGGFAHSSGLEAAWQQGEVRDGPELQSWLETSLRQLGRSAVPFVRASRATLGVFEPLDAWADALLLN